MWAFKTLWDKGLIYEGFRVLAYCWRCETPLSNTETRMDDVYRDRQDPALTVWFELDERRPRSSTWTTTPWTLPSNLALAVGPDIDYAVMQDADGASATSSPRRASRPTPTSSADADAGRHDQGAELVGRRYTPLFAFFADTPNAFQVLAGDFVSTEDGTGVVHMAPGLRRGRPDRLQRGRHPDDLPDGRARALHRRGAGVGRQHVFDANPHVIRDLKDRRRRRAPRHVQPLVPALLAVRRSRSSTGRSRRGSWRSPRSATGWSSSTSRSAGCPSTSRTAASASGSPTPATGRSAATASGGRRSRCGRATTPPTRGSTCTDRSPSSRRDFGVAVDRPPPSGRRRAGAAQPRRPDRPIDDAPRHRGARLLVRVGVDAVRAGALPVRERRR